MNFKIKTMEDSNFEEKIDHNNESILLNEEVVEKYVIKDQMKIESKKLHILEANLLSALVDPMDSETRKRYIKKWIYGDVYK